MELGVETHESWAKEVVGDECVHPKRDSGHKESEVEKLRAGPDKNS